jgi:seryl-tRNA synthetase
MLDINLIRENGDHIKELLARKGWEVDFTPLLNDDKKRKELLLEVEANKAEQNKLSASIPQVKKAGGDINAIFEKVKALKKANEDKENSLKDIEERIQKFIEVLPNTPDEDLLPGEKKIIGLLKLSALNRSLVSK